jgi:aryl carrier-like protein
VEAVLAPKVTGALTLATMCRETQPDFLVLCSSLNAIVGEFGQVDYAAANVYLDAMSRYLHQQGMPSVCINWDSWQEVGMSVTTEVRAELQELRASNPLAITPQEGVVALCRILGSGLSHVVISTHDLLHRIEQVYRMGPDAMQEIDAGADTRPSHPRPELSNAYVRPRNDREQAIADIWQQTLGIEQIGIHDNFFEVGGDSLIGLQVVARLNKQMETQIPVVKLYERPTISAFAELCDPRPEKSAAVEQSITRGKARRQQRAQRRSRKQS